MRSAGAGDGEPVSEQELRALEAERTRKVETFGHYPGHDEPERRLRPSRRAGELPRGSAS